MKKAIPIFLFLLSFLMTFQNNSIYAQSDQDSVITDDELLSMDLEQLMNIKVTTASKKSESIDDAPAAIYVITQEDIRLYGSNNIGEALRMVPGIDIIQGGDHNYEVSARGISRTQYNTSTKILWLVNGRSVYNDAFGGVRIQSLPVSMDDIERIEVIRGAGSSLYGANAFQGIINIITKNPEDQKGFFANVDYGNLNQTNASLRYGGGNNKLFYKATLGYDNIDKPEKNWAGFTTDSINTLEDLGYTERNVNAYNVLYGNVGANYKINESSNINVSSGFSNNIADGYYIYPGTVKYLDYFFQTDYKDEKNSFRFYYNGQSTDEGYSTNRFMRETLANPADTFDMSSIEVGYLAENGRNQYSHLDGIIVKNQMLDFEYQRAFQFGDKISAIAGASYRKNFVESNVFSFNGELTNKDEDLTAIFGQFEYKPIEKLNLILGGRFDHHSTVGNNFNPRFAAIYKLTDKQTLRFGAGTATRNPIFLDLYLNTHMKVVNLQKATGLSPVFNLTAGSNYINFRVNGNKDTKAEQLTSFEIGYINNINSKFQIKLDLFYNQMTKPIAYSIPVTIDSIENIENLYAINSGFATDLSGLAALNGGVDPSIPNQLSTTEMQAKIIEIGNIANTLEAMGDPYGNVGDLRTLVGGLQQLQPLYGIPLTNEFGPTNLDETYTYYGGEFSFVFIPVKNVTVTGNYAYLQFSDSYNDIDLIDTTAILSTIENPEHKINLGVKYKMNNLYAGLMFNFMSETTFGNDNDHDGTYDVDDIDPKYGNDGLHTIDARMNLTVNVGYKVGKFDFFVTGYNLIQDDYQQIPESYACTQGDYLHTRFIGGVKIKF